jgi:hypothetical protein
MLKNEYGQTHKVKCIVCLFVKSKDIISGLKFNIHARKTKAIHDMPHLGKKANELYINNKCSHAKQEIISLTEATFQLHNK